MTRGEAVEVVVGSDGLDPAETPEDAADLRAYRAAVAADDGRRVPFDDLREEA